MSKNMRETYQAFIGTGIIFGFVLAFDLIGASLWQSKQPANRSYRLMESCISCKMTRPQASILKQPLRSVWTYWTAFSVLGYMKMITIEGRTFLLTQQTEAIAFLEGMLYDLDRHALVIVSGYGMLLDDHSQLKEFLNNKPNAFIHWP